MASLFIGPAADGAALPQATMSPSLVSAFQTFSHQPTAANLAAVRALLAADPAYNPNSDDLNQIGKLVAARKHHEALVLLARSCPNLLLSPQAHLFAAKAYKELGEMKYSDMEVQNFAACISGILATGDGSPDHPFLVARSSDEVELLHTNFNTEIDTQALIYRDGKPYDKIVGKNRKAYWFDVGMLFNRGKGVKGASPAAASATLPAVAATGESKAAELAQRGRAAYFASRHDEALTTLQAAIRLDPANAGYRVDLGNVWGAKQDYDQAISSYSAAIRLDPRSVTAYSNRAFAWSMQGNSDNAIADFNAALRLRSDCAADYNARGFAYQAKGMFAAAIADYDEAIRLDPNYDLAYQNRRQARAAQTAAAKAGALPLQAPADTKSPAISQ